MITILTPTYNREYCLSNLYNSLIEQQDNDFEWIIIDDGSTDNTENLVRKWLEESNNFKIIYKRKQNGGKHRAINWGINYASGEYTFIVDSDDVISKDAVWLIKQWIDEIRGLDNFAGVSGNKGNRNNRMLLGQFPSNCAYIDATNIQRKKYGLLGDKAEVYRTDLLKKYKFPEFLGEKFMGESAVWDEIAHDGYKIRWHKEIIYYCKYLQDGLTRNINDIARKNPKGYAYVKRIAFHYYPFPRKWGALLSYIDFGKNSNLTYDQIKENMNVNSIQLNIAYVMYFFWKRLKNKKTL